MEGTTPASLATSCTTRTTMGRSVLSVLRFSSQRCRHSCKRRLCFGFVAVADAHVILQNCFNTWPFLPGHGCVWSGNKCILQKSLNLGNPGDGTVPALSCPGPGLDQLPKWNASQTATDTWRANCGLTLENNDYYTSDVVATTVNADCPVDPPGSNNCGSRKGIAQPTFAEWTGKYGNDKGSTLSPLPSDEQLLAWAREKLGM